MIEQQIRPWDVLDTHVLDVIQSVPREAFVPVQHEELAFADIEVPIGHDQVMMSPKVEGRMLQALSILPTDKVLEVGTGSGFVTACLAKMASHVTTCEWYEDLASQSQQRFSDHGYSNINCLNGDIFEQYKQFSRFDVIAITGSMPSKPEQLQQLLNHGGRMFCILGDAPVMHATLITQTSPGTYSEDKLFETVLPPLLNCSKEKHFEF